MRAGQNLPLVAIVGRPNVGKSTLYNRIVGGRPALVEDIPGVTRDRRYGTAEWDGRRFEVVDTGGLDPTAPDGVITNGIHRQAGRALAEADVILFVLDARAGLTGVDRDVAAQLRKLNKPLVVAANKVDGPTHEHLTGELYGLGLGEVFAVSASHGRGAGELMDTVVAKLPPGERIKPELDEVVARSVPVDEADEVGGPVAELGPVRLAFVGRPNAGKSSLVNRILGEERVLVHDEPGTTTDPVDTPFSFEGQDYILVDTAGMRRKARVEEVTEKLSVSMALGQIRRADVTALVIDATLGPADQDAKVGGEIERSGSAVVILVNKIDALGTGKVAEEAQRKLREKIRDDMPFLAFAPIRFVSARTGAGVTDALLAAARAASEHTRRITTSQLNKFFAEVCEVTPPPTFRGRPVRIHYLAQPATKPPTFVLWANKPELVHHAYRRFLANQLREKFGFEGSPLRIITRKRDSK